MKLFKKNRDPKQIGLAYEIIFISVALICLLLLIFTIVSFHWQSKSLLQQVSQPESPFIAGAYEQYQEGDPLITKTPGADSSIDQPIIKDSDPILGSTKAPITIVEYTDFSCRYCGQIQPVLKQIIAKYPQQVRLVFKDAPNEKINPGSTLKHEAAVCANEQNRFWSYADLLWSKTDKTLSEADLLQLAKQLGLNEKSFTSCLANSHTEQQVWLNQTEAEKLGLTATPSFFINRQTLSGNISYQQLSAIIESELNK